MMKNLFLCRPYLCASALLLVAHLCISQDIIDTLDQPRIIVLTDFFKDPDDKQSLVRFLLYANEFDIEGIIATSLAYGTGEVHPEWIRQMLDHYEKVRPNLLLHDSKYPEADSLKAVVKSGAPVVRKYVGPDKGFTTPFGRDSRECEPASKYIGAGKDSEGSLHIIDVIDGSPSPTWVLVWGGAMDLAQALWKVKNTRTPIEFTEFVSKVRLYQIHWQDTGATWLWKNVPELYRLQGLSLFKGMYLGGDAVHRNQIWVDTNIRQNHGDLGAQYPKIAGIDGIKEGDSPSFLYLIPNGLSDRRKPEFGSWGGRFRPYKESKSIFIDAIDKHPSSDDKLSQTYWTVARWNEASNKDFAARMDWCVKDYESANHPPDVQLNGDPGQLVLYTKVRSGERVMLSARGSKDPDGDNLNYRWIPYLEAGSYDGKISINNPAAQEAFLTVPEMNRHKTMHIILEVTDDGVPAMSRYRRLVINIDGSR